MENIHKSLELLVYTHNLTLSTFLAYLFFFSLKRAFPCSRTTAGTLCLPLRVQTMSLTYSLQNDFLFIIEVLSVFEPKM